METTISILIIALIFCVLYIRVLRKDIKKHYENYYNSRMEVIELEDEIHLQEKKYKRLTELSVTQTDVLNENNGVRKQSTLTPTNYIQL